MNDNDKIQRKPGITEVATVYAGAEYSVNLIDGLPGRLSSVRTMMEMSQSGMDQTLGLGKNSWQRYENGKNVPGSQVIATLVGRGFNANWILTGKGDLKIGQSEQAEAYDDFFYVPKMVPVVVSTGHGSAEDVVIDQQYHAFRKDWLASKGLTPRSLAIVEGRGDSMEPTIANGSTLLVDTSIITFNQEGIYVVRLDGHLYAKRLQRGQAGAILVISDNPFYKEIEIDPSNCEDFQIKGKVVWLGRDI